MTGARESPTFVLCKFMRKRTEACAKQAERFKNAAYVEK
ncbi:hypothetical protein HMPREF0378_1168 [Eubacterium nodatum ATCC 33099]|nr:hypothetical protein HMPREF0378_1168 [Eubacterium nodatum ATCC 33099]